MGSPDEVNVVSQVEHNTMDEKVIKEITGNEAFQEALNKEPPKPRSAISLYLYACCILGFFCSTMNGYDGSLFNSLMENKHFLDTYGGKNQGAWAGIVTNMYTIGGVVALPFVGPSIDTWGRRWGMFIGSIFVVIGTVIMGLSGNNGSLPMFMGGRFLAGFGVTIASSAGPMYVIEVSHPAYRGIIGAFYNTWWFTGSILSTGVTRGTNTLSGKTSWLVTIWAQIFFPGLIVLFFFFLPESPRWLYTRNRQDEAKAMLAKFHGDGNPDSIWVTLQLAEYEQYLEMDGSDKRWWDYRALFKSKSSAYRIFCNCCVQAFGQLAGNSVLSYFQSAAFATAGFTEQRRMSLCLLTLADLLGFGFVASSFTYTHTEQNDLSLGNACQQFFFALVGATMVDKVGRRPLLLFSNIACAVTWLAMTVAASIFAQSNKTNKAAGNATLAFQFIFGAVYSIGFTPLQALYPVEVLSFEMRAKGMAFGGLFMNVVSLFNNYVWPICLDAIGWKTYIVFTLWCAIQATVIYFAIPETKNRTLEELDEIFNDPHPVKASLKKKKVAVTEQGGMVVLDDA